MNWSLIVLSLALSTALISQSNYFVSTTGNDSNAGTIALPWKTIQHAVYNVGPGDIINIRTGTYNEKVEIFVDGTAAAPITLTNYNNENVIVSGSGINSLEAVIAMWDANYIHIDGLKVQDNTMLDAIGILSQGKSNGIEIRNTEISNINWSSNANDVPGFTDNAQPLIIRDTDATNMVNNIIIENNIIRDCRPGFSEALSMTGNVDGFEIRNNQVYNIQNIGIDVVGHYGTASANDQVRNGKIHLNEVYNCKSPYATAAGIYVDGGKDIIIERNLVYDNQWGIEIGCEEQGSTSNVQVINNLVYNNDDAGLVMGGYDYPNSGKVENCTFRNNTFFNNDILTDAMGYYTTDMFLSYTENCTIENNIFYITNGDNAAMYQDNPASFGFTIDHNLYYAGGAAIGFSYGGNYYSNFNSYKTGTGFDANSISTDPDFFNSASFDFHLNASSPSIDAGDPSTTLLSGELDFDGYNRIENTVIDLGAYEYGSSTNGEYIVDLDCIQIIAEPDANTIFITGDFNNKSIYIVNASNTLVHSFNGNPSPISYDITILPAGQHFLVIQDLNDADLHVIDMIKQN